MFYQDIEDYIKRCNIFLSFKSIKHESYNDHYLLLISTYYWKNLFMDFISCLSISTDWKENHYEKILVIVDYLTKIIYYQLVILTINIAHITEVIINVVIRHWGFSESIIRDIDSSFILKFWFLLCYFFNIQ